MRLLPLLLLLCVAAVEPFAWPLLSNPTVSTSADASAYENYVAQALDHSDANSATFQQRYFKNTAYNNSAVNVLYVEGGGVATPDKVSDETLPHVANAKAAQATLWSLEHRYFGKSRLYSDASTPNLAYLTTAQALQDIKAFIDAQNAASGQQSPRWILVGGYYGGALALWFNAKYPSYVAGVVASSPAAQPSVNYYQYEKNVEDAYAAYDPTCYANLQAAVLQVRQLAQSKKGRKRLSTDLKLSPSFASQGRLTFNRMQFFFGSLMFTLALPVQLNKANAPPFNGTDTMAPVCASLNDNSASDGVAKLVNVVSYVLGTANGGSFDSMMNGYDAMVTGLKNTAYDDAGYAVAMRLYFWLEMNELGGFPTTDYGDSGAFGSNFPDNLWLNLAWDVFGRHVANITTLEQGVNATRNAYGWTNAYAGANALITIGGADPLRHLAYNATSDCSSSVYVIDGGSLTNDLLPALSSDSASLQGARTAAAQKVSGWASNMKASCVQAAPQNRAARLRVEELVEEEPMGDDFGKIAHWDAEIVHGVPENVASSFSRPGAPKSPRNNFLLRNNHVRQLKAKFERHQALAKSIGHFEVVKADAIGYGYIVQQLDHFDPTNSATFKQYFYSNNYYDEQSGVYFLMLGGEGPIDWFYVSEYLAYTDWADDYGAMVYSLEHRFYGNSQPFDDVSTPHLKYLRSQQALADAAVFINGINSASNYTSPKWVVFGGSYPGSLSAWMRLKYPQLVIGAVSSSAPVQAKVDYYGYLQVVQNSTVFLAGDKNCANNVHRFFEWAQKQMTTISGRKQFSQDMGICEWDTDYVLEKDMENAVADIVYFISGSVQYDDEGHDYLYWICEAFKDFDADVSADMEVRNATAFEDISRSVVRKLFRSSDALTLKNVTADDQKHAGQKADDDTSSSSDDGDADSWCEPYSYWSLVDYFQQVNPYDTSERCWVYQTCQELGVFQSSNFGPNIFESTIRVNFYGDLCRDVYGPDFTRERIDANIRYTNAYYGGQYGYNGSNVVFVNGSEDPWHPLGAYWPINANVTSVLVEGTSHCEDMYAAFFDDKQKMKNVRKIIKKSIGQWIGA